MRKLKVTKETIQSLTLAMIMALLTVSVANAGPLDGVVAYVTGNLVTAISTLAVIGIGLVMLSMRASWPSIIIVCAGIWVIANAQTLSSTFSAG